MIPKVIHYCWFGGKPLPPEVEKCMRSWRKHCPDYEIRRWDESNFDVTAHPFMKAAYEAKAWAFVSDYARLKVVFDHGGIYLDTDVELRGSLDSLLDNTCYAGMQQVDRVVNTGLGFGAQAGSAVVAAWLHQYDIHSFDNEKRDTLACPYLNTRALEPLGYQVTDQIQFLPGITVYPPRYFDPISPGDAKNLLCSETVSIHRYNASWQSPAKRFKRRLRQLIGEERVMKLKGVLKK